MNKDSLKRILINIKNNLFTNDKEKSDLDRTIELLKGKFFWSKKRNNKQRKAYLAHIDNLYYRAQIIKLIFGEDVSTNLVRHVLKFSKMEQDLNQIDTEEEKTEFIKGISDNIAKIQFLTQINETENRKHIIDSLTHKVDSNIKPYVDIVTKMIQEFYEDIVKDKRDSVKKEKMNIVFNTTNIMLDDLENTTYGKASYLESKIIINNRVRNNADYLIGFLIHEYGHYFSCYDFFHTMYKADFNIEEGTQDLFEEMVINHYMEKHKSIQIDGKGIRISYPYISQSNYNKGNAIARTILYPLSLEKGRAEEALIEYQFGDKNRYLEMALAEENAKKHSRDAFGNPDLTFNLEEIYKANSQSYTKVDKGSIYCRRNYLIPIFELQRKLERDGVNFLDLKGNDGDLCENIKNRYFKGKKLYQIPRKEMDSLCDLFQYELGITDFKKFVNTKIEELTVEEIQENSFEVINIALSLWRRIRSTNENIERVWIQAIQTELNKARNGQSLQISIKKYQALIPENLRILEKDNEDLNKFILASVRDLQFGYIQQIEALLEQGKKEEVLNALKNKDTGDMFLDNSIMEVLERFDINIVYHIEFTSEDILKSAARGKIKLDDVSRAKLIFDSKSLQIANEVNESKNVGR